MTTTFSTLLAVSPVSPSWPGVATGIAAALLAGAATVSTAAIAAAATIDSRMPFLLTFQGKSRGASANAPYS
jgi:hypothetical protein